VIERVAMSRFYFSPFTIAIQLALLMVFSLPSVGQWISSGIAICDTSANKGYYMLPKIASDAAGGAYICWKDARNGNYDIYVQRVTRDGKVLWGKNGIPVVLDSLTQQFPRIISDERGGAFIGWEDARSRNNFYVYVQRMDRNGNGLWQTGGVKVAELPGEFISMANDGFGGLLLAWANYPRMNEAYVYVQRLDSMGHRAWPDSAIRLAGPATDISSNDVAIIADGKGGGIVAWSEGAFLQERVYVQRVTGDGTVLFKPGGIEISDSVQNVHISVSNDLAYGAIVSWTCLSTGLKNAQRLGPNGEIMWPKSKEVLGGTLGGGARRHTADGRGGAFIGHGSWIQHVDSSGNKIWSGDGAAYTVRELGFGNSAQASDQNQGVFNFWSDNSLVPSLRIFGQYIDSTGASRWGSNGKPICSAGQTQDFAGAVINDEGGAIVVWDDFRDGHSNVYAIGVDNSGNLTSMDRTAKEIPVSPMLRQNYPNPFNPETTIEYELPQAGFVQVLIYDSLGRIVTRLVDQIMPAGIHRIPWRAMNQGSQRVASGVYYCKIIVDNRYELTRKAIFLK
jgi:hypothetical protein